VSPRRGRDAAAAIGEAERAFVVALGERARGENLQRLRVGLVEDRATH
jgi:hypothetical protein